MLMSHKERATYDRAIRREMRLYYEQYAMEQRHGSYIAWWYARRTAGLPDAACTTRRWVGLQNKSFQRRYKELERQRVQASRLYY